MKKLLAIAIASISVAAMADDPVGYSPKVGVTEITATLQNTIVPVKFSSLVDTSNIKAKDLVHPQGIPNGTMLYVFVDNAYKGFMMSFGAWIALPSASTASGTSITPADADQVAVKGTALWLSFPKDGGSVQLPTNGKFYIFGQVIDAPKSVIVKGAAKAPVSNLLCNPTGAEVAAGDLATKLGAIPQVGDKIVPIVATYAGEYVYAGAGEGKGWWHMAPDGTITRNSVVLPAIPKDGGFWYVSKGGEGEISWSN